VTLLHRLVTDASYGDLREPGPRAALTLPGAGGVAWMHQVHGDSVATVTVPGTTEGVDALVTDRPGLALAVLVADCVPVLLTDETTGVIAVAHAGREGVKLGVVHRTLEMMTDMGAVPGNARVHLGPSMCPRCYEVPAQLAEEYGAAVAGSAATTSWGTPSLDLKAGLVAQLAGRVAEVTVDPRCTREDQTLFSYRRDHQTGRFAGLLWLEP
jgi:YfiH family protein